MLARLSRWFGIKVYYVYKRPLSAEQDVPGRLDEGYRIQLMTEHDLARYADDPDLRLRSDFISAAARRGDLCFGILYREQLVGYRWVSLSGCSPGEKQMFICYAHPQRSYSYKGFTHPDHRGKRLLLHSTAFADAYLLRNGYTESVAYTETHNFASLKHASRLRGVAPIGLVVSIRVLGRRVFFNSPGMARNGVSIAAHQLKR